MKTKELIEERHELDSAFCFIHSGNMVFLRCYGLSGNLFVVDMPEVNSLGQTDLGISTLPYLDQIRDHLFILSHLRAIVISTT